VGYGPVRSGKAGEVRWGKVRFGEVRLGQSEGAFSPLY
jgi:hypothetical protein